MIPKVSLPIKVTPAGGAIADERRHFYTCPSCGKPVDMRDLQVMLHETAGHGPARRCVMAAPGDGTKKRRRPRCAR